MSAKKLSLAILLLSLAYVGCKNTHSDNNKHRGENAVIRNTWYKHYTGTIGGKQVVADLQCYGKYIQGSYYFIDKGIIINLLPPGNGTAGTSYIAFIENDPGVPDDDSSGSGSWQLNIQDSIAKGKWTSGNGKTIADIDLKEEYAPGTYPLSVLVKGDSVKERKGVVYVTAASFYDLLQPSDKMNKDDAAFLQAAILHFLGGELPDVKNINDYMEQENKSYFDNFKKLLADMQIDRQTHEDWEYNFDHTRQLQALYNNNGMLVLQLGASDKTGGGMMGSHFRNRYICIDPGQKTVWQVKDIMDMDETKLSPLLDEAACNIFRLPKGKLTDRLRVATIPLTDNIYITGMGVTFCYYPGVIAPEEDGEICLFLPYTKLNKWLKVDFKKRMSL